MWHVLEHVPHVQRTLSEVARLLRPGGVLIAAVPNDSTSVRLPLVMVRDAVRWTAMIRRPGRSYASGVDLMFGDPVPGHEIHLQHFSARTLKRSVARAGLNVGHMGIDDHYPQPDRRTAAKVALGRALLRATRINVSPTLFIVANRAADL
jgi:SAM-dependent methyltransferase